MRSPREFVILNALLTYHPRHQATHPDILRCTTHRAALKLPIPSSVYEGLPQLDCLRECGFNPAIHFSLHTATVLVESSKKKNRGGG
jgi:hypothetical protein